MLPLPRLIPVLSTLLTLSVLPLTAPAQTPAPAPKTPLKTSQVFDWNALTPNALPSGERRIVFDGPTVKMTELECHITTLNPGQISGKPHTHANEELIIVRAGTVDVIINDRHQTVGPGSVFYFAPQDTTGIRNPGATPAVYTVIEMTVPAAGTP
jgi:XRE family transcriptional regulator, regulator of sulfur utilization